MNTTPIDQEMLQALGLTEEEYLDKQEAWLTRLKHQIRGQRRLLYREIQAELPNLETTQAELRHLSGIYSSLQVRYDLEYPFEIPLPIGSSKQDCYHKTHFINSCLLIREMRLRQLKDLKGFKPLLVHNICSVNTDQASALEVQQETYHKLLNLIHRPGLSTSAESTLTPAPTPLDAGQVLEETALGQADEILTTLREVTRTLRGIDEKIEELLSR